MKTIAKGAIRDEKGNVLILVLILLVVGGLILTPLLGLMSTGLLAGQVYERHTHRLYAADAGVEDAIWKIKYDPPESWEPNGDPPDSYVYEYPEPLTVDGRKVQVVIYSYDWDPCAPNLTYRILSTVLTDEGGGTAAIINSTTIDAHLFVSYLDLSMLLDNAIVSNNTIDIQPGNYIDGDIWLPDAEDFEIHKGSKVDGNVKDSNNMTMDWPTYEQLSTYYLEDVGEADDCCPGSPQSCLIDLEDTNTIGPCYREGSLAIDNTGDPATLLLEGTVYVAGSLEFQQSGASKNYTLDLNKQTIFVEDWIGFPSNVVSVSGPGCIIARHDIDFHPSIAGDDFVLVYSIEGTVDFQPSGDFTGCIAGKVHVQLQPGNTIKWINPEGKGLNVPWGAGDINKLPPVTGLRIESWEIE